MKREDIGKVLELAIGNISAKLPKQYAVTIIAAPVTQPGSDRPVKCPTVTCSSLDNQSMTTVLRAVLFHHDENPLANSKN